MPDATDNLDDGTEIARLMRRWYPLVIESAWADASLAGVPVSFALDNPFVQTVLGQLAKQIKGVADTTKDDIRRLVGQQAEEGWSVEELQRRIREKGDISGRTRALLIARTETAAAYSQGSLAAYKASGVVSGVEWLVSDPCPICAELDGKVVKLGDEFAPGIDAPPAHPQCTCAIAPVISD
jgi:SPP1 gp7 family putative phage head morphogenesis protein